MNDAQLPAEARARILIDQQLTAAGWVVEDRKDLNLFASSGIAVREFVMEHGHGRADYLLFVDRVPAGVIEAKPSGTPLSGVEWQSAMYANGLPDAFREKAITVGARLPFVFEASGTETHFTNGFDPEPRARQLSNFPRPETLARVIRNAQTDAGTATWRARVRTLPPLNTDGLRPAQITAVEGVERSLKEQRFNRSLIQMATGAGKTFTAVTLAYRLLKHGGFNRILFLVDRNNLADQTLGEFRNYTTPDDGRRFAEIYPTAKLTSAGMAASSSLVISTIQRVHRVLSGDDVADADDPGVDDYVPDTPVTVSYNPNLPPEAFDLIVVDEAHRSIYGVWRSVLEYFDAHIVGLTATPGKQTFGFFRQNLVSEYTYPQSVADGVNVDFEIYRIHTKVTEQGGTIEAGTVVPTVDRRTRAVKFATLDDDLNYTPTQLDRAVTNLSQIRTVLEAFRDRLFTEIFPGRTTVPKTLIFCKDDAHAEQVVATVREVFGKGNDFAAKITYNANDPKGTLQAFRTSASLRVAVTVDMIATGTDVKPLECLIFMRDVRSAQYFEQMKGRGARTIPTADFQAVTPDATEKTGFVIVDAVGVTEHDFVEPPLDREKSISLKKLLDKAATLTLTEDETATLASRLAALEQQVTPEERHELDAVAGRPMREIIRRLVDAVDPDIQAQAFDGIDEADRPGVLRNLLETAVEPLAANPELRGRILELRRAHDRVVDEVTVDEILYVGGVADAVKARQIVEDWHAYLEEHRAEITAIQLAAEAKNRAVPFESIQELADRIKRPPHNWTPDLIWSAYNVVLEPNTKRTPHAKLTDLISLMRYALGTDPELVPYGERVHENYAHWLTQQQNQGIAYTDAQRWWLDRIADVIAASAGISPDDLDDAPFIERGGIDGALRDLGPKAGDLLDQLNGELTA